jgi:hypothetical protein
MPGHRQNAAENSRALPGEEFSTTNGTNGNNGTHGTNSQTTERMEPKHMEKFQFQLAL